MSFPSGAGYPYEYPITWGSPSGAGYPNEYPIVWTERYAGQHCSFLFYPLASFQADIALKGAKAKTFMADISLAPHFDLKKFTADIVLKKRLYKPFYADIVLQRTQTKTFGADISLYSRYQPSDALKAEQQKSSYIP